MIFIQKMKFKNKKFFKKTTVLVLFIIFIIMNTSRIQLKKLINNNVNNVRICICTIGKEENRYIREFVYHYKKYGIDKIFLYDNNDIDNERFEDVLSDFNDNKFVEILNYRGIYLAQFSAYEDCYLKNNKTYNWLIFYDIDEFINLKNYTNVKQFLSEKKFNECPAVYLNCLRHTDNNLLYYDNRTLAERFPIIKWKSRLYTVKSILKGNISEVHFKTCHWIDRAITGCNSLGEKIAPNKRKHLFSDINNYKDCYIDHYCFKSTEEYINKIRKGDAVFGIDLKNILHKINSYFTYNEISYIKIRYIESKLGIDLKEYRMELKKKKAKNNDNLI